MQTVEASGHCLQRTAALQKQLYARLSMSTTWKRPCGIRRGLATISRYSSNRKVPSGPGIPFSGSLDQRQEACDTFSTENYLRVPYGDLEQFADL